MELVTNSQLARDSNSHESHVRSTFKNSKVKMSHEYLAVRPTHKWPLRHFKQLDFNCVISSPLPTLYILSLSTKLWGGYQIENPKYWGFHNIHLLERATHPQDINPCSLFSSYIPLSYLDKIFFPITTHTQSECWECFGAWKALGLCQIKPVSLVDVIK